MQTSISVIAILDQDEFVIGYAILYLITIVKMVFVKYSPIDLLILLFGVYVFYRRYLMVIRIDRMCSEIADPLKDAIENIENFTCKKTT
jgi:hypothetical protein